MMMIVNINLEQFLYMECAMLLSLIENIKY